MANDFQPFWLGLWNESKNKSYINSIIFLTFINKIIIDSKVDKPGATIGNKWQETEPNKKYNYRFLGDLHPGSGFRTNSLRIKFSKADDYEVVYQINVRNKQKIEWRFNIKVK